MSEQELIYFKILKKEVVKTLQNSHSVSSDIENWKGKGMDENRYVWEKAAYVIIRSGSRTVAMESNDCPVHT